MNSDSRCELPMAPDVEKLFWLCAHPIDRVSQAAFPSLLERDPLGFRDLWRGVHPVLVVEFRTEPAQIVAMGTTDRRLVVRFAEAGCEVNAIDECLRELASAADEDPETPIGLFGLDSVMSPVSGWPDLRVTRAMVLHQRQGSSSALLGLCLWINLGIRIGVFVSWNAGLTLAFNDSCDRIIDQALEAQARGVLEVESKDYPANETPQLTTLRWFDDLPPG